MPPDLERPPPPDSATSDRSLVRYIRGGDQAAVGALYRRYEDRLRKVVAGRYSTAYAARFDPDDVVQSVFRVFCEGVRSRHYDVPEGRELWGLLSVLAVNKLRDQVAHHRAAKRSVLRTDAGDAPDPDDLPAHDGETDALLRLVVDEFLTGLPEPDRTAVGLRMTGHTTAEIASKVRRGVRTVERVLQRARDRLADILRP